MTTANRKAAAAPEPIDPNESGILLSFEQIMALSLKAPKGAEAEKVTVAPIVWAPQIAEAAAGLPVPVELPTRYLSKGLSKGIPDGDGWVSAPANLETLNKPAGNKPCKFPLDKVLRCAITNDWGGQQLHNGKAATEGGTLPVALVLMLLGTKPELQCRYKWAQTLTGSQSILEHIADISGRYAILRPSGITLVRDFYAAPPAA
jgi:hypothetical protein